MNQISRNKRQLSNKRTHHYTHGKAIRQLAGMLTLLALGLPTYAADNSLFQSIEQASLAIELETSSLSSSNGLRSRQVTSRFEQLEQLDTLELNLFDDTIAVVEMFSSIVNYRGALEWTGSVVAQVHSDGTQDSAVGMAVLIMENGLITGDVQINGESYRIEPSSKETTSVLNIIEEDPSRLSELGRCTPIEIDFVADPIVEELAVAESEVITSLAAVGPENTVVRVLVFYTSTAKTNSTGILAHIDEMIVQANFILWNSGLGVSGPTFELAGTPIEVAYTEKNSFHDMIADFKAHNATDFGAFDTTRVNRAADMVTLIVDTEGEGDKKGSAYSLNTPYYDGTYSVIERWVTTSTMYFGFAHELAHNFGAEHDPATTPGGPYTYGHGYVSPDLDWRTVMAYSGTCPGDTQAERLAACPVLGSFSTPLKTHYSGQPTGNTHQSDNVRVLDEQASNVANLFELRPVGGGGGGGGILDCRYNPNSGFDIPMLFLLITAMHYGLVLPLSRKRSHT